MSENSILIFVSSDNFKHVETVFVRWARFGRRAAVCPFLSQKTELPSVGSEANTVKALALFLSTHTAAMVSILTVLSRRDQGSSLKGHFIKLFLFYKQENHQSKSKLNMFLTTLSFQ